MEKRIKNIVKVLDDNKANDILEIDLRDRSYIVDFCVIASCLNAKHGLALLNHLKDELKPLGEEFLRIDENDSWCIVDLGDICIHIMSEEARAKYSLENFLETLEKKS